MNMNRLFEEFSGITNKQAYDHVFLKRMMIKHPILPGIYLGNTQRDDFLPYLRSHIKKLPLAAQIFDVGAGAGDIVDLALCEVPSATVHIEEPNEVFIEKYKQRLSAYANLLLGQVYPIPFQGFYDHDSAVKLNYLPPFSQDLILALHMVYFLSDYTQPKINPIQDLKKALRLMYELLNTDGAIFLVYADQLQSTTGRAGRYYYSEVKDDKRTVDNLDSIWNARDSLLRMGNIKAFFDLEFPGTSCEIECHVTRSFLYGKSKEDIAALCLAGELLQSNDDIFDIKKLEACVEFVEHFGSDIGLTIEDRDIAQKGMFRCNQPQVITLIRKRRN